MQLSIVIPTINRIKEIEILLNSISNITNEIKDFEIIIVDQNRESLLDSIIKEFSNKYIIHHHRVTFSGLSKAKNYGVLNAVGDYVIFMDDDAEFLLNSIKKALEYLNTDKQLLVVCGRVIDRNGRDSVGKFYSTRSYLSLNNFEDKFIESAMIFRRQCFNKYSYDETLGAGTFHGAEEGYDLIYRMLLDNIKMIYDPNITFYHPHVIKSHINNNEVKRAFTYRCGFAALCKKHGFRTKYYKRLLSVILYLPYLSIFKRSHLRYYKAELIGLLAGRII